MADIRFSRELENRVQNAMKNAMAAVEQSHAFEGGAHSYQLSPALPVTERRAVALTVLGSLLGNEREFKMEWPDPKANDQAQANREKVVERFSRMLSNNPKFAFANGDQFPNLRDFSSDRTGHFLGGSKERTLPDPYALQARADLSNFNTGTRTSSTPGAVVPFAISAYRQGGLQVVAQMERDLGVEPSYGRLSDVISADRAKAAISAACQAKPETRTACQLVGYR